MAKDSRFTKRQLKKLAKEQTGIVKKDPNNLIARLKLAGALKDLGKDKEAVTHYREVAKVYASTGKLVQAISVYKGILEIDPGHQKTEAALSDLSVKRAKEIKAKSMPRLQQQDDGRWVMPTESDVSEDEGTDPGIGQGKGATTSPSVLRLPAPMPTDSSTNRRRRGRRSRPRMADAVPGEQTSSTPSFESVDVDRLHKLNGDIVLTADEPTKEERNEHLFLSDDLEEPTSPGPSGYNATIRKSAVSINVGSQIPDRKLRTSQPKASIRRTLVGVPLPEIPDIPKTPLAAVPPPEERTTGELESPLPAVTRSPEALPKPAPVKPLVDNKQTVQMEREPDMPAPTAPGAVEVAEPVWEPQPLDESTDETLGSVFDDEEEAFWNEFEGEAELSKEEAATAAPEESEAAPGLKPTPIPKPTLLTPPMTAPKASQTPPPKSKAEAPRSGKGKRPRKSSKMTIPMGAAAFKKAVEAQDSRQKATTDEQPGRSPGEVQLEEIALFRDLSETSREMLQFRLVRRTEKRGAAIVREGDPGNALFVVSSGQVRVTKQDRQGNKVSLATLGPGSFFGEFALLSDRKRHATVTVVEDGVFFEISRKVIADLTQSDPSFGNTLRQFYRRRLLGTLIRSAPFFDPLSISEREALMGRLRFRRIPEKTKIITEGEPGGGFFLILIGEVEVTKPQPDGTQKVLSKLTDGSYFGEMSLLKGGNAVATVTTVTPTEIVQLAAAEFYRILSKYPQIWEEVNREAKRRELANLQILSGRAPEPKASDDSVVM